MATIQNKKTGLRYRVTDKEWEHMQKTVTPSDPRITWSKLYTLIDMDDSSPLNEEESSQSNVPEELKSFTGGSDEDER